MFGKKKAQSQAPDHSPAQDISLPKGYTPPKGSATPKRRDVQAANRRPVVADRRKLSKEEKKQLRLERRKASDELYYKQQAAMRTGDDRNMPAQHKGKQRRFGRDVVDAFSPISGWFMPLAILLIPLMVLTASQPVISYWGTIFFYIVFVLMLLHGYIVAYYAKILAEAKFGAQTLPRGYTWQMLGRGFYPRRWRLPAPQVKRGQYPEGGSPADLKAARAAAKAQRKKA